jgi:tetratricopeptide (TPR) repeat protein
VIIFERAHLLRDGATWRDEAIGTVMTAIISAAHEARVKLVFETQRELPLELSDPSVRQRLRVTGLRKHLRHFGVSLFDAQLRRNGLSPDILPEDSKGAIVERLGGHPVAITLAADASYEEGGEAVLKALKDRRGFYLTFFERLLRPLSLTDEDETILRLLTLARIPIDRAAMFGAVSFPAAPVLRNLVTLGAVETARDGRIEIAGVLREYFDPRELAPELIERFHSSAADAFEAAAQRDPNDLEKAIEAEYHGGVVGKSIVVSSRLLDGALATAQEYFRSQRYEEASSVVGVLLRKRRSLDILRLAAQIAARLNDSDTALSLAHEVLQRDPKDTRLLSDLVKISLSQYQDDRCAIRLVELARSTGVEDVSILLVEGRMHLRHNELYEAEQVFLRAQQLTRFNSWPYYYLGTTYHRMGQLGNAIDVLEDGLEFFYRSESRSRRPLNAMRTQLGLAYLFNDDVDAAARVLDLLFEEDPSSPEVVRAYAALTIKRDGVQMAEKAFARLSEAKIRNRFDRCQFHLFYGLFQLGIGNPHEASQEFSKAHAADRSNVYVMMKWAQTLYDIALNRYLEGEDIYRAYVSDCTSIVERILNFDPDNSEGVDLMFRLRQDFGVVLGGVASVDETGDQTGTE